MTPQTHGSVLLVVSHRADLIGQVEGMGCRFFCLTASRMNNVI